MALYTPLPHHICMFQDSHPACTLCTHSSGWACTSSANLLSCWYSSLYAALVLRYSHMEAMVCTAATPAITRKLVLHSRVCVK